MRNLRKRFFALVLSLVMALGLLPGPAYAALGDLLADQELMAAWEEAFGEDAEEIRALMDSLGLLDEDGNLITDCPIVLDGEEYTLESIQDLLSDTDADLTRVAYIDGTPIALGDLKTILDLEEQLLYLQETYFSGRTFSDEALDNLNSLMAQLQTTGLTLTADSAAPRVTADQVVLGTPGEARYSISSPFDAFYISSAGSISDFAGRTFSVKFKLAIPEYFQNLSIQGGNASIVVGFAGKVYGPDNYLTPVTAEGASQTITIAGALTDPDREYELTYTPTESRNNGLFLYVSYQAVISGVDISSLPQYAEYSFGTLTGGVSFYGAEGFLFEDGSDYKENYNLLFSQTVTMPELVSSWTQASGEQSESTVNMDRAVGFELVDLNDLETPDANGSSFLALDKTIGYLDACKGTITDYAILQRFRITASLRQTSGETTPNVTLMSSIHVFHAANDTNFTTDLNSGDNFPINLPSAADGTPQTISFNAFNSQPDPDDMINNLPIIFYVYYYKNTTDTNYDSTQVNDILGATGYVSNASISLVNDKTAPNLTISAPAGTYQSGDLVPITIAADEYIQATDETIITINEEEYTLSQLHGSTKGKFISFLYEVKEIDAGTLTVTIPAGTDPDNRITDFFGNGITDAVTKSFPSAVTEPATGITLVSPLMTNAVESLGVEYTNGALEFTIAAKQEEAYHLLYQNAGSPMQLLITVDSAEPVTYPVTMGSTGSGADETFTFMAEPYSITPTSQERTVTVQLQVNERAADGTAGQGNWVTVHRVTQTVTVDAQVDVKSVTVSRADGSPSTTIALDDASFPQLQATFNAETGTTPTYTSGSWSSDAPDIANISNGENNVPAGTIIPTGSAVGEVTFTFTADNGTPNDDTDDVFGSITFTVTPGSRLTLSIPQYAQDSLIQSGDPFTVIWVSNAMVFYPKEEHTFTVTITDSEGNAVVNRAVTDVSQLEVPADTLTAGYPQSEYTVTVTLPHPVEGEAALTATASLTVLSPPTQVRITADTTSITDADDSTLTLNYSITGNEDAGGVLSVTRMEGGTTVDDAGDWLSATSVSDTGTVTFTPSEVEGNALYDTYTITLTEDKSKIPDGSAFTPSADSIVIYVYQSGALSILVDGTEQDDISLSNQSVVNGYGYETPLTDSEDIMELRQTLGLIRYVSINADDYNWSSFRDGIRWALEEGAENVAINYKQGGLWDNIEDLPYETYLPQSQMAVSATGAAAEVTVTATHAATGMTDTVTVSAETLQDQFYLFQATPAAVTTVTYTNRAGEVRNLTTNSDGLLAVYEPSGIDSDVQFSQGSGKDLYLGTIARESLSSGERDAAKLQLYPLNAITLVPAAQAELYLVKPDGTPYVGKVTLRGGVYLGGYYCGEDVTMSNGTTTEPGNEDNTYTTDSDGKLTVQMDATQFIADGFDGPLTNAALDYWFELRNLGTNNEYYPVLVNIQGAMSADRILRTGSAVVMLEEVPDGEEEKPYLTAQTLSYGESSDGSGELQTRSVLGSTGTVGPNSTYQYAELTSHFILWGVSYDESDQITVSMTGETGFAPAGQTTEDSTFPFAYNPVVTNTTVLTKETMTDSGWLEPETAETLRASVYQDGALVKQVTMPFRVIDLTEVKLVNEDATAVVAEMQGSFLKSVSGGGSQFNFVGDQSNKVSNAFTGDIGGMLEDIVGSASSPLFQVLITPSEDNSVFNAIIWGGYNSLNLADFNYEDSGFSMDYQLMESELDFGVPSVNELGEMATGTYDPADTLTSNSMGRSNNNLDFGAQLEGYYEGQFYYDTEQREWCFRAISGGFTAGAGVSFQANVNAWVGPIPITGSFGAGIALQLDYKAATVYTDQQDADTLATWTDEAKKADSVNDYLTTLRINGYLDAFGGFGFDYTILALKIGLFGQLAADSTNRFLSRTYLADSTQQQLDGQALGISGEVGIKFVAKFLFISYETVIGSGSFGYNELFSDWGPIKSYWNGTAASGGAGGASLQMGAPTLLSRAYLAAYANSGAQRWESGTPSFDSNATSVQNDANPGSEPAVNDDGSLSVYISDENSENYFDSRIYAGSVGAEGEIIDGDTNTTNNGHGDMSPSLSGDSSFTVAAWIRLFEDLSQDDQTGGTQENSGGQEGSGGQKGSSGQEGSGGQEGGEDQGNSTVLTSAEQKRLLNSTEIMVATTSDKGENWTVKQLTKNASPDLAPVTASDGEDDAVVVWRSAYASSADDLLNFDTQNAIYYSRYDGTGWSDAQMVYNGSLGSVVGLQTAMLSDGTAIVAFTVDRATADTTDTGDTTDYEMAYRVIGSTGTLHDLVVLTSDGETDTNPQAAAVSDGTTDYFVLGWYSTQDGGDIRLQAVGADGQLYSGGSEYAVPASVKAVSQEEDLVISSDFRFAKRASGSGIDGLTLVWAETAAVESTTEEGDTVYVADHSVLYGAQLCKADDTLYLSTPQALITLPDRTLANSFSAWRDGDGKVSAYIFGTYYLTETESVNIYDANGNITDTYKVAKDTDKLLTGGGTMLTDAISVDSIAVDYANLRTESFTPVVFALRNTGTTALSDVSVNVGSDDYTASVATLAPGESASVTVLYKTGSTITNPTYTATADTSTQLATGELHLDYNDIGISSMKVVEESEGKRTVLVTLYNDSAAKLKDSGRTVELSFYTDSEHSDAATVVLPEPRSDVAVSNNTVAINDNAALHRIDQGSMTLLVTYDLESHVTGTLSQQEVPASGVYLYASAAVKENSGSSTAMAEYATGNNSGAVLMTGAYARTGEKTTLDVTLDNTSGQTKATVTLKNNSLQKQPGNGTLLAVLLDENGSPLETKTVTDNTDLDCEETKSVDVQFSKLGADVILLYAPGSGTGLQALQFSGMDVELSDFVLDSESGNYVYTLPADAPASTVVTFISDSEVTVNGTEYDKAGSAEVSIPTGSSTITVSTGGSTYVLTLERGGSSGGSTLYAVNVAAAEHGSVQASPTRASRGRQVTLTVTPEEGYELASLTVTSANGSTIALTDAGDGRYTFTMPASRVTVTAVFQEAGHGATCPSAIFTDVDTAAWYHEAIDYVVANGLMGGVAADRFSPNSTTTRAQIVTILWRLEGEPAVDYLLPFEDVAEGSWYTEAVRWAASNGIVTGTTPTTFRPDQSITREQMAAILYRYASHKGYDTAARGDLSGFTDLGQVNGYAVEAMAWANGTGIISGTTPTTLSPQGNAIRAQAAAMLMRFCEGNK